MWHLEKITEVGSMVARTGQSRTVGSRDLGKILNSGPKHGSARFIRPEIRTTNRTKKPDTRWTKIFLCRKIRTTEVRWPNGPKIFRFAATTVDGLICYIWYVTYHMYSDFNSPSLWCSSIKSAFQMSMTKIEFIRHSLLGNICLSPRIWIHHRKE